jgi:hypothetical protein
MAVLPAFIDRAGGNIKALSLHRTIDWLTGLSLRDYPYGAECLELDVEQLVQNGFIVRADEGAVVKLLFRDEAYIEPNLNQSIRFDTGHITVWHPDPLYWDAWHMADKNNVNTPNISPELAYFARAIVRMIS